MLLFNQNCARKFNFRSIRYFTINYKIFAQKYAAKRLLYRYELKLMTIFGFMSSLLKDTLLPNQKKFFL